MAQQHTFAPTDARQLTEEGMTVGVVTNPAANRGHGRKVGLTVIANLVGLEASHGIAIQDLTGTSALDSLNRVRTSPLKLDALVVVGGDGMVSLGVNAAAELGIPLGIVACGSGNDFARGIGLPINRIETSVNAIVAALTTRTEVPIDLGHVESFEDGGKRVNKYYAGQLSCGVDAQINQDANVSHLPVGPIRYFAAAVQEIVHLKQYGYSMTYVGTDADGNEERDSFDFDAPLLSVANSRFIGGGIEMSPKSDVRDGLLDLIWTRWKPTGRQGLNLLRLAYHGDHLSSPVIGNELVTSVTIEKSDSGDVPPIAMADGEIVGELPLRVTVAPAALKLLVPPSVETAWEEWKHDEN
ncbi:MAG: diacylglycerol kinase [Bifidobacteriaceae bacterium]|jgi:diacylglycerol kinase family enzyme|nr:diacylglycerol kinase [Bifidobacteriaceae bacterium]